MLLKKQENISRVITPCFATFIALFIFIGNLGKDSAIQQFAGKNHGRKGNTYRCSCQSIMSNVPLRFLSGFYRSLPGFGVGTNILEGLGL